MLILGQLEQIGDPPHPPVSSPVAVVSWPCPPGDRATDVSRHWIKKKNKKPL